MASGLSQRLLQARIAFLEQHCDCPPPPAVAVGLVPRKLF
jgi:hypothetical protein